MEDAEASRFATEDTLSLIGQIANDAQPNDNAKSAAEKLKLEKGLGIIFIYCCAWLDKRK